MKTLKYILPICLVAVVFASCDSLNKMVKLHPTDATYTATPNPLEKVGDKLKVDIAGQYKPKYFNKKAAVVFQPELKYDGGSLLLKPFALHGDKAVTEGTAIANATGGNFTYSDVIPYSDTYKNAKLVVNPVAYFPKKAKNGIPTTAKDALAVKKATYLTEKLLAEGINTTADNVDPSGMTPSYLKDAYKKDVYAAKTSALYFEKDKDVLNVKLAANKDQSTFDEMVKSISKIDLYTLESVSVEAWASPEGELSRNNKLAENRTKVTDKYLKDGYEKVLDDAVKNIPTAKAKKIAKDALRVNFNVAATSKGEDWGGFMEKLAASNIQGKDAAIRVVNSASSQAQKEAEIRKLLNVNPQIEDYLSPLRRGEMTVTLKQIMKPDAAILAMAIAGGKELTIEEILYAGTLTKKSEELIAIYKGATDQYPNDYRGWNDLAYTYIKGGKYDEAQTALNKAKALKTDSPEVLNNLGIVAFAKGDVDAAKKYFEDAKAKGSVEASANLGAVDIAKGNYAAASSALSAKKDINYALTQILNNDIAGAKQTLGGLEDSPKKFYLLAVCAARQQDDVNVFVNLKKTDLTHKKKALTDVEFRNYVSNHDFLDALK
ncbi:MAG: tetratricopeptide repeat protein [Bacteroidales bacterium]|jgi:tetratricopeptide (TPR) repeat protein|nr:tetratricopeptide repeat protein [Bacteroidales bacterium]